MATLIVNMYDQSDSYLKNLYDEVTKEMENRVMNDHTIDIVTKIKKLIPQIYYTSDLVSIAKDLKDKFEKLAMKESWPTFESKSLKGTPCPIALVMEEKLLARRGNKIGAIKALRERMGIEGGDTGLKACKDKVDEYLAWAADNLPPFVLPAL